MARAIREKKIRVLFYNPRDFVKPTAAQKNKPKPYLKIDDKPYGGGPGMVMQALPIIKAIDKILKKTKSKTDTKTTKIFFTSPSGKQFTNEVAEKYTDSKKYSDIIIICGRYEGIDSRIKKVFKMEDITVGPFVLTGGELPAMIMIDSITRRIPGVLGNSLSLEEERISSSDVYTRPEVLEYKKKTYKVPKILLTGHHAKIDGWKSGKKGVRKSI